MSSIIVGGYSETGDWVYNPTIDDYEFIVTGGQGYPACSDCCECPTAAVEKRSRSASKSKCGFSEYSPASSPPKIYQIKLLSGSGFQNDFCYDTPTGTFKLRKVIDISHSGSAIYDGGCTCSSSMQKVQDTINCPEGTPGPVTTTARSCGFNAFTPNTQATTTLDYSYDVGSPGSFQFHEEIHLTLSSEYTTATLITNTLAALPAFGSFGSGSPTASRNLSTDELSYAIADSVYRFRFKVPKVGGGTTYIIKWVERFSPEGGGTPTDTIKTFTWSGTPPGGYDATDSTTWPLSDEYTMAIPATDGTVAIACVTVTCSGTAPTDPCNP